MNPDYRSFYELHREEDNLIAVPYVGDLSNLETAKTCNFDNRKLSRLFKKYDYGYDLAWGQYVMVNSEGKYVLSLLKIEDFNSSYPIDKFSWEDDDDCGLPNYHIILEELK